MPDDPKGRAPEAIERKFALLDHLRQTELRATSSRVASVIGHLIGTPLNVIAGRAALIRANPSAEYSIENARRIEEQVERLAQRIRRLIEYLTAPEPAGEPRDVAQLVEDAISLYAPIAAQRGVVLGPPAETPTGVTVDGTSTLVVLTSLLSLGMRIAPRGSAVTLGITPGTPTADGDVVVFEVKVPKMEPTRARIDRLEPPDDDERINAEHLQVLSVCYAIARRNGGRVEVVPDPPDGASIRFECRTI
jgi:signal transduction histidine kinase